MMKLTVILLQGLQNVSSAVVPDHSEGGVEPDSQFFSFTFGHKFWTVIERITSWSHVTEMSFLHRGRGLPLHHCRSVRVWGSRWNFFTLIGVGDVEDVPGKDTCCDCCFGRPPPGKKQAMAEGVHLPDVCLTLISTRQQTDRCIFTVHCCWSPHWY